MVKKDTKYIKKWIGDQLYCDALSFNELEMEFEKDYPKVKWIVLSVSVDEMLKQGLLRIFKLRKKTASNEDYCLMYTTKETKVWIDDE